MKKIVIIGVIVFIAITQIASIALHINGIAGYTNSPGEITCTSCHTTYPLNSPGGNVAISIPSCSNSTYIVGQTYTVNVKISRAGLYLFGFGFEALDSTGANAGTLTLINTSTTILLNALVNTNNRTNVTHYGGVLNNDSCAFSFKWTAPTTYLGKITFYTSANASNNDGYTYGDYIYTASQILIPSGSTGISENESYNANLFVFINEINETINLQYILNENHQNVSAQLYSVNGTLIGNLFSESQSKGLQKKEIEFPLLPSKGIYFVKLFTNSYPIGMRKIVVY